MKTYTIDRATWRRGGDKQNWVRENGIFVDNPNSKGEGEVLLKNCQGYYCCLGFISQQEDPTLTDENLFSAPDPADLNVIIPLLNKMEFSEIFNSQYKVNTDFSHSAIQINDNPDIDDMEREKQLLELGAGHDVTFKFIN